MKLRTLIPTAIVSTLVAQALAVCDFSDPAIFTDNCTTFGCPSGCHSNGLYGTWISHCQDQSGGTVCCQCDYRMAYCDSNGGGACSSHGKQYHQGPGLDCHAHGSEKWCDNLGEWMGEPD